MKSPLVLALSAALGLAVHADDTLDAGLMRMPAVSEKQIAFVYAGDIWVVAKEGGTAMRLSSPRGEESWPRFSPDGREVAFSGNYEGNDDVYVMPVTGGEPRRVTYHGDGDRMVTWWPDGKSLVFASRRETFSGRVNQFFKINAQGGFAERMPMPYAEFGSISPDGKVFAYVMTNTDGASWKRYRGGLAPDVWLYNLEKNTATNLTSSDACESQPMWAANGKLYFLSDNDAAKRSNLWQYDPATKASRQITKYTDYDVRYPSIGPKDIVFENGGHLYLFDLATEQSKVVKVDVITDKATLRPRSENVSNRVAGAAISPTGKRVVLEARGDLFSVPAENGVTRNLTDSDGVAERYPAWSPDGKWLAYFSDRSGEYELTIMPPDGKGQEQQLTHLGAGAWRYQPYWSPDSKKLVFIDSAMKIWLHDLETKQTTEIDHQLYAYHSDLQRFKVSFSSDSRWITYGADREGQQQAIVIYDTKEGKLHQVTSAFYDDDEPVFDPAGNYLFYRSRRIFQAHYSDFDNTWAYVNSQALICVTLRKDMPSPLAPRNDEEPFKKDEPKKKSENKPENKPEPPKSTDPAKKPEDSRKTETNAVEGKWQGTVTGSPEGPKNFTLVLNLGADGIVTGNVTVAEQTDAVNGKFSAETKALILTAKIGGGPEVTLHGTLAGENFTGSAVVGPVTLTVTATREAAIKVTEPKIEPKVAEGKKSEDKKEEPPKKEVKIDLEGFESRAVVIPVGSGRIDQLGALPGKVIFRWPPRVGAGGRTSPLSLWDIESRSEKQIVDDVGGYEMSGDGKKLLLSRGGAWSIANAAEGAGAGKGLNVSLEMTVDPVAEWKQLFSDAWRIERDFFYDPHLHMVSWQQMRERYGKMLSGCVTRSDVNYVLGELLGELNSSHTYRSGGDIDGGTMRSVGYLGCDYALENNAYRIKHILRVAPWDTGVRSPLAGPGVNVKEGDYLLAVNGRKLNPSEEPYLVFQGLADRAVILTVNDKPTLEGSREVLIQTVGTESGIRHYAWLEGNRKRVEEATKGRCGYIYVPSTALDGQTELYRQWRAQAHLEALVIDERWNSGGQIPDRFIELLNRPTTNHWGVRDGRDWTTPFKPVPTVKVMLANRWSGSGGDCFPWLFQQNKLGPVIGTRTWGGLIGMTGCPALIDGGSVTVPTFSIYDNSGKWIIEGHGVDPDIEVIDDPAQLAKGVDPQLERAIVEIQKGLEKAPKTPARPAYQNRTK